MATAVEIARHLIWLAWEEQPPPSLSPLYLQKLLYYVQGWGAGIFHQPIFQGRLEAWKFGPVAPDVYQQFKQYEDRPIPVTEGVQSTALTCRERALILAVWTACKGLSTAQLCDQTHTEQPWLEARGDLPEDAPSSAEISLEALEDHFAEEAAREESACGVPAAAAWASLEQFERGQGRSHKDVFARLRQRS